MTSLAGGPALHDALKRTGLLAGGRGSAPVPPREFVKVATIFRLEALWELDLIRSR
jgi:hypothetical protein